MPFNLQVEGHLDLAAMKQALAAVTKRHEMLRTSFSLQDDEPQQRIPGMADVTLRMESRRMRGSATSAVEALRDEQSREPDDLTMGPLLTLIALKVDPGRGLDHLLCMTSWPSQHFLW